MMNNFEKEIRGIRGEIIALGSPWALLLFALLLWGGMSMNAQTTTVTYNSGNPICNASNQPVGPIINPALSPSIKRRFYVLLANPSNATLRIDSVSGNIAPDSSNPGTFTVRMDTFKGNNPPMPAAYTTVIIESNPIASINYIDTICISAANPLPVLNGAGGGTFSVIAPANPPATVGAQSGVFDLSTATAGTAYTIQYTVLSPLRACTTQVKDTMVVTASPNPTFSYNKPAFCKGEGSVAPKDGSNNPITGGNFSATPPGLNFVSTSTGEINTSTSSPNTYTITNTLISKGCTTTYSATVTLVALDSTTIAYPRDTFCITAANPTPSLMGSLGNGTGGGAFSSTPTNLVNAQTGVFNLSSATANTTYTVRYVYTSQLNACRDTTFDTLRVTPAPNPSFGYSQAAFCKGDVNAIANDGNNNPVQNGSFTASPSGLVFKNASTGEINTAASVAKTYIVTNTLSSQGCTETHSVSVSIVALDSTSISYPLDTFCNSAAHPAPTLGGSLGNGTYGGTFSSSPTNLVNAQTGVFNLTNAMVGSTYTIKYVYASQLNACQDSVYDTLAVVGGPDPSFAYDNSAYCVGDANPVAKDTTQGNPLTGSFSAFPSSPAFILNPSTGQLNVKAGTPGAYVITNTQTANGCTNTYSFSVTLSDTTPAGFSYPDSLYCKSVANPRPTVTVPGGRFTSNPQGLDLDSLSGEINLLTSLDGTYYVKYQSPGNCSQSDSVRITILPTTATPIVFLVDDSICVGDTIQLSISKVNSLRWYNSAVITDTLVPQPSNPNNPNPADLGFSSTSPYQRPKTVYVTDDTTGKCTSPFKAVTLMVSDRPTPTLTVIPNPSCSADTVLVSPNGADNYDLFRNGMNTNLTPVNGVFQLTGLQNLDVLQVEGDRLGCSALSRTTSVRVNPTPVITFTFSDSLIVSPSANAINLNTVVTPAPNDPNGSGVFSTSAQGLTLSGGTYLFDPSIFSSGDRIIMNYQFTTTAGCAKTRAFKIVVDSSAKVINAIRDGNNQPINGRSFCQNASPFIIQTVLNDLTPYDVFCNIETRNSQGTIVSPSPLTPVIGQTGTFTFSPSALAPGNYTFELITRSTGDSCLGRGNIRFSITGIPLTPAILDNDTLFCQGAVNPYLKINNPEGGNVFYVWADNGGVLDTVQSDSFFIGQPALPPPPSYKKKYYVSTYRKADNVGCTNGLRDSISLQIFPIPATPQIVVSNICVNDPLQPLIVRGEPGATYRWVSGNNTSFPATTDTTLDLSFVNNTLPDTFLFSVSQTRYANIGLGFAGCTSSRDSANVIIFRLPEAFHPDSLPDPSLRTACSGRTVSGLTVSNATDTTKWWADAGLNQLLQTGNSYLLPVFQTDTFYLTRTSRQGCQGPAVPLEVKINPLPVVSFSGLDTAFCSSNDTVLLQGGAGSPFVTNKDSIFFKAIRNSDSTLLPQAFVNNGFVLANAGIGAITVRYVYKDTLTGCVDSSSRATQLYPSPHANFSISGRRCLGDTLSFVNTSTVTGPSTIRWVILKPYSTDTVRVSIPNAGLLPVSLKVTSGSCSDSINRTVFVGSNPNPEFSWTNSCEGDSTLFTGSAGTLREGEERISSYAWDFGDGTPPVQVPVPDSVDIKEVEIKHVFPPGQTYLVRFSLGTKEANPIGPGLANVCRDTVVHEVPVSPTVALSATADYLEDFEVDEGGWLSKHVVEFERPAWQWVMPNGNVIQSPANNAWMTILRDSLQRGEQSWVLSPCFDFRQVNKPMIKLDIWSHTPNGRDGVVLQSSLDDGKTWKVVGGFIEEEATGLEWYNQSTISSKPGRQTFGLGWSGLDTDWRSARHKLDQFIGKANVRFRLAFGLDSSYQVIKRDTIYDGFAFDNVFIGERKKTVLLEHFTNLNQASSAQDLRTFYRLVAKPNNPLDVVAIQYHVAFPAPGDAINRLNPDDPEARAFQYGVKNTGRLALNGNEFYDTRTLQQHTLDLRSLEDPLFEIDTLFMRIDGDSLRATTVVTAAKDPYPDEVVFVHFAVVEDSLNGGQLQSVLRKLVPDNGGQRFRRGRTWTNGSQDTLSMAWYLDPSKYIDSSQLEVVVFVQEEDSNTVYQAATTKDKPSGIETPPTSIDPKLGTPIGVTVFPNPAAEFFYVRLEESLLEPVRWVFTDLQGKALLRDEIPVGTRQFDVPCGHLPAGIYLIHLESESNRSAHKKVVIRR